MDWLLFLPQLPANPSSIRVRVWRRMRAAGALGLQNGVWLLPNKPEHVKFLTELLGAIQEDGASGHIFTVGPVNEAIAHDILKRFRSDRDEEYTEFCERCQKSLSEISKETEKEKFTFAELEDVEQDYRKLERWLRKIQWRDFAGGPLADEAARLFSMQKAAHDTFSNEVYRRQGLDIPDRPRLRREDST